MSTVRALPRWDMTVVYPGLNSPAFEQGFAKVVEDIEHLAQFFDTHGIMEQIATQDTNDAFAPLSLPLLPAPQAGCANIAREQSASSYRSGVQQGRQTPEALTDERNSIQTFEEVVARLNAVLEETQTLNVYITCFVNTNTQDTLAQAQLSELQQPLVALKQLLTRFTAWIGSLDVDTLLARSQIARDHTYILAKARARAAHLMTAAEETLASELNVSGGTAWAKLHGDITSQLSVALEIAGEKQALPMSVVRNLAYDADRDVRKRAYEAELDGWQQVAVPLAAALNSIKGEVIVLARHGKWASPLDASLFESNIDRETLEAMLTAARESLPDFHRYLHTKARALNLPRLTWYDLFAPVGNDSRVWEYTEAAQFITQQFGTFSTRLSNFAARAFHEQWIDAEPRPGKVDGAYCTPLRKDESRVFANFKPSFGGVSTLAHELGHGYHNLNLAQRTALQQETPMTLAETASIFCETIIRHAAMQDASSEEQIAILEASLQGSCQVVVDITSRFLFEQRVFERRRQRELSVDEFNALMLEAQRETYGDGLDESTLHPYMWAMKPHYYSTEFSFYNYPYMFGLLFGLGLYARYQQDPEGFKQGYDDLLSQTGLADAATLAARFGIDIRSVDFWRASLDIVRADIRQFEELIAEH